MAPSRSDTRRRQLSTASGQSHDYQRHSSTASQLTSRADCIKCVRELNRELARHTGLSHGLGSWRDGDLLRTELRRSQQKAHQLVNTTRLSILPHLRGGGRGRDDDEQYEKLWHTFTCCLELLAIELERTLSLQRTFPLHTSVSVLIHTGVSEAVTGRKSSSVAVYVSDGQDERARRETADCDTLSREVAEVRQMVEDANQAVSVQPWTIEPEFDLANLESKKSLISVDASMMEIAVFDAERQRRRRCICIAVTVTMVIVVLVATIVGVTMAVRSSL